MHHDSTQWMAKLSILGLAILNVSPLAMAQQSSTTGEFRKDQSSPKVYSQEGLVDNFAQQLPVGATFAPLLTAWDADDGDLTARLVQLSGVNTQLPGQYVAKYQVTDNGLPTVDGFKGWGKSTTTYSLPVTVYDPALQQPEHNITLGALWQDGDVSAQRILLAPGQALSRSILIDGGSLPLLGDKLTLTTFQFQEAQWGGNNRQFTVMLTDMESGEQVANVSATVASTRLVLAEPVSLQADKVYRLTLSYLSGPNSQGFRLNADGDFWLQGEGQQTQALNSYAQVLADPANQLAFDPGLSRPLKEKMLSSKGGNEALYIRKLPAAEAQELTYVIQDPALASVQVLAGAQQDKLVLSGLRAGETNLEIRANGQPVDLVRLVVTLPKEVSLSYSYIAFPGETKTHLWDDGALIERELTRRYAPYNIQFKWVDNGVLVHDWDKDGNGDSYAADRSEQDAPLKEGWIPNQEKVFSNLYVLRRYKDDAKGCAGSGGGSSTGSGPTDAPPREGHRAACPGNATELGQALTLAHELGHNLGLWHTKDTDPNGAANLMYVGRQEGIFFANQWRTIHQTLVARLAAGEPGVREGAGPAQTPPPLVNQPPLANAGGDLSVTGPVDAVLDGAASRDPEGKALRYQWRQLSGTPVTLARGDEAQARIAVPASQQDSELAFELTVTDAQGAQGKDQVRVHNGAMAANRAPTVSLPATFTAKGGQQLNIEAQGSDPDGDALTYQWQLPAGLVASGLDSASLTITAPELDSEQRYELTLTVTDGALDAQASTRLTVQPKANSTCASTDPEAAKYPAWQASKTYTGKEIVSHDQLVWQARYWTKGNAPTRATGHWALVSQVRLGWETAVTYNGGDLVNHGGHSWQARYWSLGNEPGKSDVWVDLGVVDCP
jgi:chitodextrinase